MPIPQAEVDEDSHVELPFRMHVPCASGAHRKVYRRRGHAASRWKVSHCERIDSIWWRESG